jgi:hypothetical protein
MAKRIVAPKPGPAKGPATPQKPLTLADLTIRHAFRGNNPVTLTGGDVAAILEGAQHLHAPEDEKSDFVNAYAMYFEVVGIAETLDVIAEEEDQLKRPLHYLADQLKRIANRICALDPGRHSDAASFVVEVTR